MQQGEVGNNKSRALLDIHHGDARGGVPEPAVRIFDSLIEEDRHCLILGPYVVFLEGETIEEEDVVVAVNVGCERIGEPFEFVEADVGRAAGEPDIEDKGVRRREATFPLHEEVDDCPLESAWISPYFFERFSPCKFHFGECTGNLGDNA